MKQDLRLKNSVQELDRYDLRGPSPQGYLYKHDRWTGETVMITGRKIVVPERETDRR